MVKTFSLESAERSEKRDYHARLLSIINDIEKRIRVVSGDPLIDRETHAKKFIDARKEVVEFEPVRRDICESFGVKYDTNHIFHYDSQNQFGPREQRTLRAFFVLIDTVNGEGFYGEGRIDHNTLLNALIGRLRSNGQPVSFEEAVDGMGENPPRYLVFKGFLSIKDFKEISDSGRKVLETPVFDEEGTPIETAENWFITGHNLQEPTV